MGIVLGVVILSGGGGCELLLGILFAVFFCFCLFLGIFLLGKMIESVYLWSWVSIWRYWLVHGGTGLEYGGTSWELLEMGQNMAMLAVTWLKRVLKGGTGCYLLVLVLQQGGTRYFVITLGQYRALMPLYNEVEGVVGCHLSWTDFEM